jgi:hypothetical protein
MNILSIDVGIKNLGYCLFKITDKNVYCIKDWDVINLCGKEPVCEYIKQGKKITEKCDKKAKLTKNNTFFCKIHAKKQSYKIPSSNLDISKLKKMNLHTLINHIQPFDIDFEKPITKTALLKIIEKHNDDFYFDPIKNINTNDVDLITLGKNIYEKFNILFDHCAITHVIIENQLSPLASRMKTLQGMLSQYFIMKNVENVEFISAINKLKLFIGNRKTSYQERKKIGIFYCKNLIQEQIQFKNFEYLLSSHKKLDDLADSFLQGLYYLINKKIININSKFIQNL